MKNTRSAPLEPFRLGVLVSGRGSNLMALQSAIDNGQLTYGKIVQVISNRVDAPALDWAKERRIPVLGLSEDQNKKRTLRDTAILDCLKQANVDVVLLAGYDRILGSELLAAFPGRILNIHPSLLPAYGGKGMVGIHVHEAVISAEEKESGCTVHLVTDVVDGGSILGQAKVPVFSDDTPALLADRILQQEHQLYARTVEDFLKNVHATPVLS